MGSMRKKPFNSEKKFLLQLIRIMMVAFPLRNSQTGTLKLLRSWDTDKLNVKTKCWNPMNNINIVKSSWKGPSMHLQTNSFKNSACSMLLKLETYHSLLRTHSLNFLWRKKFKAAKCKSKLAKQTVKPTKIRFTTNDFNSTLAAITIESEYSRSIQASEADR